MSELLNISSATPIPLNEIRKNLIEAYTLYVSAVKYGRSSLQGIVSGYIFDILDWGRMQSSSFDMLELCDDDSMPKNVFELEKVIENELLLHSMQHTQAIPFLSKNV